ncbi:chromosome segregation protein SMC [Natronospira bacteriovora]|uniref:Chromosome partition protein Smc n=1 Tax=Natronospira bacteriovora TaxID=3069753 RepID=A0ABU0W564_9GAMM|nr:chromosome segregation protein SMC [Natronospira sp. AB-CW4]MDQ2069154.1 chromosome segregation protein SMC [Natronospira sp. AB-CW4]
MRLSKIKLAGFKSFVDPTTITFPTALTGIIGPNGCGKSNVIDAVRWVMGETSAKHLRGASMADVIFNGSTSRKPVGTASIELVFDNSDGSVGGQYAGYNEISVRRQVSRDGTSSYYLNGSRCRRRDIQDIFLGTGLGPRSYAIIEQGMISRLIEAKPEELRVFLEEAAGISKYKERRRETENRIRHTRENLDRLSDLREEVEKQLNHLDRQARTAEKYKALKGEERELRAQLLALRIGDLDGGLESQDRRLAEIENRMQAEISHQRSLEKDLEAERERQAEASESFNSVQARYYSTGAEISRVEQAIQHARELRQRQVEDLERAEHALEQTRSHIRRDEEHLSETRAGLEEMEPGLERLREAAEQSAVAQEQAEAKMNDWQERWDRFSRQAGERQQTAEVGRTRIEHMESQIRRSMERVEKLRQEKEQLSTQAMQGQQEELREERSRQGERQEAIAEQLDSAREALEASRGEDRDLGRRLHERRQELQSLSGRISSLEALQQAALKKDGGESADWLARQGLEQRPRLAERIQVESGWERAVETVLAHHLEAVTVDEMALALDELPSLERGSVGLVTASGRVAGASGSLAEKVQGPAVLGEFLAGVRVAESVEAGNRLRADLREGESVICPDGTWLGREWLRVTRSEDEEAGVLEREQTLKQLQARHQALEEECEQLTESLEAARGGLKEKEGALEDMQREFNQLHRSNADLDARLEALTSRIDQANERREKLAAEIAELEQQIDEQNTQLKQTRGELESAVDSMQAGESERRGLEEERDGLREQLEAARRQAREDRDAAHELALKVEARRSSLDSTQRSLERMQAQLEDLSARRTALSDNLEAHVDPVGEHEEQLETLLERRKQVDEELGQARRQMETIDAEIREKEKQRVEHEKKAAELREDLEKLRLESQEARVRRETLVEQLEELETTLEQVKAGLPEEANVRDWAESLEGVERRIARLGNINLAAIDEFREQSERKQYLDAQFDDLTEALETLEAAIRKIDRETRTRFKETFDKVNSGLKETFPRLFGGGHAYLEMTGEDLLDAGVAVMARPPGKRNSSISALSGGEKALTAVALVFSIFELNPAPFCMLDEVDAPLDDANVGRFCALVKEMSERVQFIFITHNKITMELSNQLLGVTMNEPGVSRLVSVDVDEAVEMASA